jgi:hypothetical protein
MSDTAVAMICDTIKWLAGGATSLFVAAWMLGFFDRE